MKVNLPTRDICVVISCLPTKLGYQKIVQWVSDSPYISRHYTARQQLKHCPEAGQWIHEKYARWLDTIGSPVFWIRGTSKFSKVQNEKYLGLRGFFSGHWEDFDHVSHLLNQYTWYSY